MFNRNSLAMLIASAMLASPSSTAQQSTCPIQFASSDSFETGVIPACAFFAAEVYNPTHGTAESIINADTGAVICHTCEECDFRAAIAWDFAGCTVPMAFSYNECAQVSGSGLIRRTIDMDCGTNETVTYEVGEKDPSFNPADCDGSPFNGGAMYTVTFDLECTGC